VEQNDDSPAVRKAVFTMPLTNPAYPRGPYRFYDREFSVITYRTDPEAPAAVVPEPLEIDEPGLSPGGAGSGALLGGAPGDRFEQHLAWRG
jgi:hypothetical protein